MAIGTNIKRLRERHALSQAELAAIADVSDKAVSTWENGLKTPRMGAIQKIADYFGITKSELIEDSTGDCIKKYRMREGMSLIQLAEEINIDPFLLEKYEADVAVPSPRILNAMAFALRVDVPQLLGVGSGYEKTPVPVETEAKSSVTREQSDRLFDALVSAGLIVEDDLAPEDIQFLGNVSDIILNWFARKNRE